MTWSSVAAPAGGRGGLGGWLCRQRGIGVLRVAHYRDQGEVREDVRARPNRRGDDAKIIARLQPEHETYCAAGAAGGGHWTPFKATCREVLAYVREHPGCTVKDLVAGIRHHYATPSAARAHLPRWIEDGKVPGVRLDRSGRRLTVHLADGPRPARAPLMVDVPSAIELVVAQIVVESKQ